ncbi:MAG: efflux RND transporter periplasmic adaptor subunit [Anaerolineales bacterium]|nr:efflux RND transporter periplasmic adaptor subunit [Anaerolineales bacterium]
MKQFFSRFSRRTWIIVGVVAIVLLVIIFANSSGNDVVAFQTTPVERGNLVASVGATGSVRAKQSAALIWQTSGIVQSVNVEVGSRVARDEALASLDKNSLSQNIILAEADLLSAQKALEDLLTSDTARLEAQKAVDNAEKAYDKAYNWRMKLNGKIEITDYFYEFGVLKSRQYKGYASEDTVVTADKDLALAEARLADARRAYERLLGGADSAEAAAAEARVAAAQSTLNMAYLTAPFDGTITQANPAAGDQVTAGTVGFRIDDLSHLLVDVQVSEVDINSVSLGQPGMLTFDAILGREYHGEVVQVGQAGDTVQGVVSFTVTIELDDADELVKPGMTAAVNIVVEEVKDVVLIPNRAVRLVDGDRVVYVLIDGLPVQVKVKLGSTSGTDSTLVEGDIKEGDLIILNPPSTNGMPFGG